MWEIIIFECGVHVIISSIKLEYFYDVTLRKRKSEWILSARISRWGTVQQPALSL